MDNINAGPSVQIHHTGKDHCVVSLQTSGGDIFLFDSLVHMTQQFYPLDKVFSPPMMDDGDPYEGLPESSTLTTHMIAGAAAGLGEHCIMYPFDCVKTRMQSLVPDPRANYRSVPDALVTIFRHEGLRSTMRGVQAVVGGAVPAHAMYFACYEQLKRVLSGGKQGNHLAHGVAGCAATLLHDAFMNPADVIKQRMQIYGSPHRSCRDCGKCLLKNEGMRAFYRSYTTQLSMNIPFQAVHFMMYEVMQDYLNPARRYDPVTHGMSGGVAGACAAIVTMPLDVCKTLLNTQEHCARTSVSSVEGMCSAFKTIYQFQGVSGYFRGLVARVCFQMPATAISWSVYEFFKYILSRKQPDDLQYLAIPIPHSVQAVTASKTHAENS